MRNKKLSRIIHLTVAISALLGVVFLLSASFLSVVQAAPPPPPPTPLGPTGFLSDCSRTGSLAKCINGIYILSLGLGALLALLMIILAGYRYMTAGGNAQQVEGAREAFTSAFIGLIVLFIGFALLFVINPDLTKLRDIKDKLPAIPKSLNQ